MRLPLVSKLVRRYSQKRLSKLLANNSEEMDSLQLENRLISKICCYELINI